MTQTQKQNPGIGLRQQMLTSTPDNIGIKISSSDSVYGVLMEFLFDSETVMSVAALLDGNASIYTNNSFNMIGGSAHETVREAAKNFISVAQLFYSKAVPVTEFPYPVDDQVFYYLLTQDGVRQIITNADSDEYGELYGAAQMVIFAFRSIKQE